MITKVSITSSKAQAFLLEPQRYEPSFTDGWRRMQDEAEITRKFSMICMFCSQFPNTKATDVIKAFFADAPYSVKNYTRVERRYFINGIYLTERDYTYVSLTWKDEGESGPAFITTSEGIEVKAKKGEWISKQEAMFLASNLNIEFIEG